MSSARGATPVTRHLPGVTLGVICTCFGCPADPTPLPSTTPAVLSPPSPSKADLFGSALLVPSRAGERARLELALAGEIERMWHDDRRLLSLRAFVGSQPKSQANGACGEERSASVVARLREALSADERTRLESELARSVAALAAVEQPTIVITAALAADSRDRESTSPDANTPALAMILLGAGLSFGVALERWRLTRRNRQGFAA